MTSFRKASVALVGLAMIAGPVTAAAQQQTVLRSTHKAWEIRCAPESDACVMQQIGKVDGDKDALLVTIRKLSGVNTQEGTPVPGVLTAMAPLGVILTKGLGVRVDSGQASQLPFQQCLPQGCVAQTPIRNEDVSSFKRGAAARFEFFLGRNATQVSVSLSGFTAAYNALPASKPEN